MLSQVIVLVPDSFLSDLCLDFGSFFCSSRLSLLSHAWDRQRGDKLMATESMFFSRDFPSTQTSSLAPSLISVQCSFGHGCVLLAGWRWVGTLVYLFVCLSLSPLNTTLERNTVSLFAEVSGLSPDLLTDMDDGADLQGKYVSFCISPAGIQNSGILA